MKLIKTIDKQEQGIALVISIIVLAALFGLVIVVSDVSLDILKSNKGVGLSEAALFAAESAVEITVYEIEKDPGAGLSVPDLLDQPLAGITGVTWSREVKVATSTPGWCAAIAPSPVCTDSQGVVDKDNRLKITLEDSQSFQMDLNIVNYLYPDQIEINLDKVPGSRMLISGADTQIEKTSGKAKVPPSGKINPADNYSFRLINESGGQQTYEMKIKWKAGGSPGNGELPMGLNIRAVGKFLEVEREIQLTRPAWVVY